jgi:hypothetical protein
MSTNRSFNTVTYLRDVKFLSFVKSAAPPPVRPGVVTLYVDNSGQLSFKEESNTINIVNQGTGGTGTVDPNATLSLNDDVKIDLGGGTNEGTLEWNTTLTGMDMQSSGNIRLQAAEDVTIKSTGGIIELDASEAEFGVVRTGPVVVLQSRDLPASRRLKLNFGTTNPARCFIELSAAGDATSNGAFGFLRTRFLYRTDGTQHTVTLQSDSNDAGNWSSVNQNNNSITLPAFIPGPYDATVTITFIKGGLENWELTS